MRRGKLFTAGCLILGGCVAAAMFSRRTAVGAIFDESTAVRYEDYAASHTIEQSVLFVGTHLIHVQSMTDELYEKALESASDSNQSEVYYKSELAEGAWFNITDASGLSEISGQGTVMEESELADLWVTCYTGSDGITKSALTDGTVNIFDTPDPYDLSKLPELEPLRIQYENVFSEDSEGVDQYYYEQLRDFFELRLNNETTDLCDRQLRGLQSCYEQLKAQEKTELAEIVSKLMGKIDSRRRAEIFSLLSQGDANELSRLQELCGGSEYDEDDYDEEQFVQNMDVSDALGTSLQNCQESYIEHSGNMISESDTVLGQAEYEKSMEVTAQAEGGFSAELETLLYELSDLYHIRDDVMADSDRELSLIEEELLPKADEKYQGRLSAGSGSAYEASAARGAAQAVKTQLLDTQKTEVNSARAELEYLITAKTKRQPAEEAVEFTYERIGQAEGFYAQVPADDFKAKASETIDEHILWLQEKAAALAAEGENLGSAMDGLEEQKTQLTEARAEALDHNDLSLAKKYEAQIAQVDEAIAKEEERIQAVLSDPQSSAAEKARAMNQAGSRSTLSNINKIKNEALTAIAEGNLEDSGALAQSMDALASLGAESALTEIKDKLEAAAAGKNLLKQAETAIADSRESSLHDRYGGVETDAEDGTDAGGGSGTGDGTGTGDGAEDGTGTGDSLTELAQLSEGELEALIEAAFGAPFEELGDSDQIAAIAALSEIWEQGNTEAGNLARGFLNQCAAQQNPYVYGKRKGVSTVEVPLSVLAHCGGYRYIYSSSGHEIVLSRKARYLQFEIFSDQVTISDGTEKVLTQPIQLQDDVPYLAEADGAALFGCQAIYIDASDYGICLDQAMQSRKDALMEAWQEGAE